ncbi:MAG: preprotein translocase subunit SecD [Acutalibacteraceae bacterium]|jgi:protein-export membrane protein SecD
MKRRTSKVVFFIVFVLIAALAYTTFCGVYTHFGDRQDTVIRSVSDIRFGIDIRGGVDVTFAPADDGIDATEEQIENVKDVIERRMVGNGITDYEIYADTNNDQVIARFPWKSDDKDYDVAAEIEALGKTAMLSFHIGGESTTDEDGNTVPSGELVLTGEDVASAAAKLQQDENGVTSPVVELKLKDSGTEAFANATATQYASGGTISIWLDNEMISNPTVRDGAITNGQAVISGSKNLAEAGELAALINAGALPFSIKVASYGTVTPTMGERALEIMVLAGIIAFALITVFMVAYYRLPGVIMIIALVGQISGALAAISGYFGVFNGFTLTLPGIAGVILSIGMGVDCNVITAERVREELRSGKTIDGAVTAGCKNSFSAIFDGNITVLIVSIVLMGVFGPPDGFFAKILYPVLHWFPAATTGAVYSFGFTLFVGIVLNFLMGMWASRLMLKSITRFKVFRKPWLLGGDR